MELKVIAMNKIIPNPEQPREHFDRDKIRELSESILSNGLINPITVREKGSQYEIVTGERRWKAHQVANIKTIQAFVKKYSSEGQVAIESLIENVHRENLTPKEKGKFLLQIKKIENISTNKELSKRTRINITTISECIDNYEFTKNKPAFYQTKHKIIRSTAGMEDKERSKIIKLAEAQKMSGTKVEEEFVPIYKKSTPEIKNALLDDKITVSQAENLNKIKNEKAREKATKDVMSHNRVANIIPKISINEQPEITDMVKKKMLGIQKMIFTNLYDAKVGIIKSSKGIINANKMLNTLLERPFEHGLDGKTLSSSITQLQSISDKISEFTINIERFNELKENFVQRVGDRND